MRRLGNEEGQAGLQLCADQDLAANCCLYAWQHTELHARAHSAELVSQYSQHPRHNSQMTILPAVSYFLRHPSTSCAGVLKRTEKQSLNSPQQDLNL